MLAGTCEEQTEAGDTPLAQSRSLAVPMLYFLTCRKPHYPIKIGISATLRRRLNQIKTAAPYDLVLLFAMPCDGRSFELEMHREFATSRLNGEWFKRNDRLMDLLRSMRQDFPAWRIDAGFGPHEYL